MMIMNEPKELNDASSAITTIHPDHGILKPSSLLMAGIFARKRFLENRVVR
jgi:hypothetical protein